MADLVMRADRHRTSVHTSNRRFIGDAARDLARQLPGQWDTSIEIYSHPAWQEDLVPWIWDSGELGRALQNAFGTDVSAAFRRACTDQVVKGGGRARPATALV
ncbi:hypothetical protein ACIO1C_15480 [Streptomyces sp. NPDC087420]|uniref:hypothetical protein n=1 Tax=Streptomyces sp. NPDC087420 TaxID=3365785 RepID=UPI003832FB84